MVFVVIIVLLIAIVVVYTLAQRGGTPDDEKQIAADDPGARADAEEEELRVGARQHRDHDFGQDRPLNDGEQEVVAEKREGDIVDKESSSDAS